MTRALSLLGASPGEDTPRPMIASNASARRRAGVRSSSSPSGPLTGADKAASAASMIAAPSGSMSTR
uniref:Uncharacterized protein n=1 Tax=Janibacter limosus TaxID=53458 RepID=A0AC61U0P3_9MICO|nr:hypothetical protein [Janibacter limosus]